MNPALPRTRSLHRVRPMRLWWLAVAIALLVNLGVILGLSQASRLFATAPAPPLAARSLRRLPSEPPPAPPPTAAPAPAALATAAAPVALPSLDLPPVAAGALALPAIGLPAADLILPLSVPAYASVAEVAPPASAPPAAIALPVRGDDGPPELAATFDLDRFYPRTARVRGLTGSTRLRLAVAADGSVTEATVVSSQPAGVFDAAALRLARSLRLRPARRDGVAVAGVLEPVITWTLP